MRVNTRINPKQGQMAQSPSIRITRGGTSNQEWLPLLPPLFGAAVAVALLAIQSAAHHSPARPPLSPPAILVSSVASASEVPEPTAMLKPVRSSPVPEPEPLYIPEYTPPLSWPLPGEGYPISSLLVEVTGYAATLQSTNEISELGAGHFIPKNLRCARSVSSVLHNYVPTFYGHDLAEVCSRRIQTELKARKSKVYRLQEQMSALPDGYLFVICLLKTPHSGVGHICFYDPLSGSAIGNSDGVWRSQTLDAFWPKYQHYYLLGVPVVS